MSFSKNFADKLAAAKALANDKALVPTAKTPATSISHLPPVQVLNLPPLLQQKLDEVMTGGDPSAIFGWFRRWGIESRVKTNQARANEITSVSSMIQSYASVYKQAVENQRLPERLHKEHQLQDLQLQTAYKVAMIADGLVSAAIHAGMPLELYLNKLNKDHELEYKRQDKELELEFRAREFDQDLEKQERTKQIEREHDRQHYNNKIMNARLAKNEALQLTRQVMEEIDTLHSEIDQITNDEALSPYLRKAKIKNRREGLAFWEEQRVQLRKRFGAASTEEDA